MPKTEKACCGEALESLSTELFKALGDPNRVSILTHLAKAGGPQTVTWCPLSNSFLIKMALAGCKLPAVPRSYG